MNYEEGVEFQRQVDERLAAQTLRRRPVVEGDEPGKVRNARVRCTCGAEINYAEKICRSGHGQSWMQSVEGVGPDAPTETNENGASQSTAPYAFTSLDPHALFRVAQTAAAGDAKYGVDNWRGIPTIDHLNHALTHIYAHLADDISDDHLAHAACRMLMALAIQIQGGPRGK